MEEKYRQLQKAIGHRFKDESILIRALTHPTHTEVEKMKSKSERDCLSEECPHQQVYSTLGDAVLKAGLILILIERNLKTKGDITKSKANLEKNLKLSGVGKRLRLLEGGFIKHQIGNENEVKRASKKVLADTIEALIAAIFIDSNLSMKKTKRCIEKIFAQELSNLEKVY